MEFEARVEKKISVTELGLCSVQFSFQPSVDGPCRDQPLGSVHPVESGSITTGEPSFQSKRDIGVLEKDVRGGSLPSACF